jgi:hypothetical protein
MFILMFYSYLFKDSSLKKNQKNPKFALINNFKINFLAKFLKFFQNNLEIKKLALIYLFREHIRFVFNITLFIFERRYKNEETTQV